MIPLKPIDKRIRKELHLRELALTGNRKGNITDPKNPEEFNMTTYLSKVPWVRMISPVNSTVIKSKLDSKSKAKNISTQMEEEIQGWTTIDNNTGLGGLTVPVIGGGYLSGESNYKIKSKFDEIYNSDLVAGYKDFLSERQFEGNLAPRLKNKAIPGIESVSVSYEGGFKAWRKAEIQWKCHTLEDVDALLPHFLTAGRTVILEFGWWYSDRKLGTLKVVDVPKMLKHEGGRLTLDNTFEYTYENSGNTEMFSGIISNFDITTNDDGSFDCRTTLISEGVDMFKRELSTTDVKTNIEIASEPSKTPLSKLNFKDFINHFGNSMIEKYGSPEHIIQLSKDTDGNIQIFKGGRIGKYGGATSPQLYVSWGWFEDNVISKFLGTIVEGESLVEMRSYDEFETGHRQSVVISNHKYLFSPDLFKFILPGQIWPPGDINRGSRTITGASLNRINDSSDAFASPDGQFGYLRNILLNWNVIQQAFGASSTETVQQGFENLFQILNSDLGIWDFKLILASDRKKHTSSDETGVKNRLKVIDNKTVPLDPGQPDNLYPKSLLRNGIVDGEVYEFPIWTKDSIVRSQNFTVSIPDGFAVAAMYGNNDIDGIASEDIGELDSLYLSAMETSGAMSGFEDLLKSGLALPKHDSDYGNLKADISKPLLGGADSPEILFNKIAPEVTAKKVEEDEKVSVTYENWFRKLIGKSDQEIELEDRVEELKKEKEEFSKFRRSADGKKIYLERFYFFEDDKFPINPIYKDIMTKILRYRIGDDNNKRMLLLPFRIELEIDGIGGILPGNSFTSFYLPKRYKNKMDGVIFQVMNVEHTITDTDWVTKLEGIMSYKRSPLALKGTAEADEIVNALLTDIEKKLSNAENELIKADEAQENVESKKFDKNMERRRKHISSRGRMF